MEENSVPPPINKKRIGTISSNADEEFLKVMRDGNEDLSLEASNMLEQVQVYERKDARRFSFQNKNHDYQEVQPPRRSSSEVHMLDEDEATNFLIEENIRRQKRYFGSSLKNSELDDADVSPTIPDKRNPTLGEIVRGGSKGASKRSLQEFPKRQRHSSHNSSGRNIIQPPPKFCSNKNSCKNENGLYLNQNVRHSKKLKGVSPYIQTPKQKSSMNNNQNIKSYNKTDIHRNSFSRPRRYTPDNYSSEIAWLESIANEKGFNSVQDVINSIENGDENGFHCMRRSRRKRFIQDEFIIEKENGSLESTENVENDVLRTNKTKGIADHPERDSLDGNLPGSSHGTSSGNPPPPPTPPGTSSNGNDTGGNINNNNIGTKNNNVNNNPDGSPPAEGENANFSKGPNAKSKKHKRLKTDNGTLDFPSREKESSKKAPRDPSPKNRDIESGGFRTKTEPYTYLWVVLSRMYGKLIILLMLAFCLTEVLDNKIAPLTFQEVFLLYLYVGSIVAIMCIYVTVIIDNCPSITASKENLTKTGDPEVGSITSFGTLKRAHISRSKTSRTSFYLRVGALVFGLGTLIYNGLEIAMQSAIPEGCISDTILAHPIMQALFTFLQMHFLFVNSEVIVEKFGQIARFGFMHLVATNLALWVRMVVWESANDSMTTYQERGLFDSPGGPKALGFHSLELQRLSKCYQNNTLGQLWIDSQQYLFPFIVQYSLIAASVTYIMWCNVGKERIRKLINNKIGDDNSSTLDKRSKGHWQVDCRSASKGLFLGLLVLVGGIVILIIFFVMKDHTDFRHKLFWMNNGTMMVILSLCIIATIFGFIQIPKLSVSTIQPMDLDRLLLSITVVGVYIFAIFGMIVGGIDYNNSEKLATFSTNTLLLIQVSLQGMLVAEASRRTCSNRFQMLTKPGRQVITFLLFSNITLWILDTFMTHNSITHQFQIDFYGRVVWGVISRISLPLMMLFRFHSAVILVEIWKNTYRTKAD